MKVRLPRVLCCKIFHNSIAAVKYLMEIEKKKQIKIHCQQLVAEHTRALYIRTLGRVWRSHARNLRTASPVYANWWKMSKFYIRTGPLKILCTLGHHINFSNQKLYKLEEAANLNSALPNANTNVLNPNNLWNKQQKAVKGRMQFICNLCYDQREPKQKDILKSSYYLFYMQNIGN